VVRSHGVDGYDFTHGKLRDAAYDALGPAARQRHHVRVAETLASGADADAVSGQVAAHLERGGRTEEAVPWYCRAAAQALRRGASEEAVRLLEQGRALAAALPTATGLPLELEVLSLLPAALGAVDGYSSDRLAGIQQRAVDVAGRLGVDVEPPMLKSLVMTSLCRDEFDAAASAAERLLAAGLAARDEGLEMESRYLLGIVAFWAGDLATAEVRFREVVDGFDPDRHLDHVVRFGHEPRIVCLSRLANTLGFLGRRAEAEEARERAIAMADRQDDSVTVHVAHLFGALLALDLGDTDGFRRCAAPFRAGLPKTGLHLLVSEAVLGVDDALEGRADSGAARIQAAIAGLGGRNLAPSTRPIMSRLLVDARSFAGDAAGTLAAAADALALPGTRLWEPEVRRLRALALAASEHPRATVDDELDRAAAAAAAMPGPAAAVEATRQTISKRLAAHPAGL
jgi:tetratricopeptide (TPR) repeat protein